MSKNPYAHLRRKAAGRRTFTAPLTLAAENRSDGRMVLEGHAAVFDSESEDLGGFVETIAPGAFRSTLAKPTTDPFLLFSHDPAAILARVSAGSLTVTEDQRGLAFTAELVPTQLARDVYLLCRTGHLTSCSFAFTVASDHFSERDGQVYRRIKQIGQLLELSVVAQPAYPATQVDARGRDLGRELAELRAAAQRTLQHREDTDMSTTTTARGRADTHVARDVEAYGPDSPNSYFRDLALSKLAELPDGDLARYPGHAPGDKRIPRRPGDTTDEARRRLATVEKRAISSGAGTGGEFIPAGGIPLFIAEAFTTAARARAVAAQLLNPQPLPEAGLNVKVPRFTTGASVVPQASEGSAVSATDPGTASADGPVALIAGEVVLSNQLLDLGLPAGGDAGIAAELGAAYAAKLDDQIISGAGASGEIRGLRNWSGISTYTWTQASPTQALFRGALGTIASTAASALGAPLEQFFALVHPRRHAWLLAAQTEAAFTPAVRLVGCPSIPTNVGGSQDVIVLVGQGATQLYTQAPTVNVIRDRTANNTAQAAVQVRGYASLVVPVPVGVGVVSGSGLATPGFTT